MQLLGAFPSQLTQYLSQGLVALLQAELAQGGYGAGTTFNLSAAQALATQAQSFAALPVWSAGQVASSYDVNQLASMLQTTLVSLLSEIQNAASVRTRLLQILATSEQLVDQLRIEAAELTTSNTRIILPNTQELDWPLAAGYRWVSTAFAATDPVTGITTSGIPPLAAVLPCAGGTPTSSPWVSSSTFTHGSSPAAAASPNAMSAFSGALVSGTTTSQLLKDISWSWTQPEADNEILGGSDWSRVSLLYDEPVVTYSAPVIQQILPPGGTPVLNVSGAAPAGMVPTYVSIQFSPRTRLISTTAVNPLVLSPYVVQPSSVVVWDSSQIYIQDQDYTVASANITFASGMLGKELNIQYVEAFPGYQCSTNQANWSSLNWLDPANPNPEDSYPNIRAVDTLNGALPVTDEEGNPTGVYIALNSPPQEECKYLITVPGSATAGVTAVLTLELARITVINSVAFSPSLSSYSPVLTGVVVEGIAADVQTSVLAGSSILLTEPVAIRFAPITAKKIYLYFRQESYTLKQYQITPPDALRRQAFLSMASLLPPSITNVPYPAPIFMDGAVYELGIEDIVISQVVSNAVEVVLVGPLTVDGVPDVVTVGAQVYGYADLYLLWASFDSAGTQVATGTWTPTNPTQGLYSWAFPSGNASASTQFLLKIALRGELSIAVSAQLQSTTV